ncbi:MAG: hypothetical protein DRP03_00540 [Candidatus Aenigmatarchaeota archaeon]|nr:MAG: hypothetical protein DRP03_00540 [Candidatus Aenigmarchaeota archaeon]
MSITNKIILVNIAVFLAQIVFPEITPMLAFIPSIAIASAYWQFVTYMFMHAGIGHILINMFILYIFGNPVERALGAKNFVLLYFLSGIGSAIFYMLIAGISSVSMVGASGAVFGILTAYAFIYPKSIVIIFPGIPMPAYLLIIVLFLVETFFGITGSEPGIANFGHVGGILTSAIIMIYLRRFKKHSYDFEFFWE